MSANPATVGFLTVVTDDEGGRMGGYLVADRAGRPLEFHCTVAVKPTRAQEILYGPTLEPYLCGEQIAVALISKAKVDVDAVLTDCSPVLAAREVIPTPVGLLLFADDDGSDRGDDMSQSQAGVKRLRIDAPHSLEGTEGRVTVGGHSIAAPKRFASDADKLRRAIERLYDTVDVREPFERIRLALAEAQRAKR